MDMNQSTLSKQQDFTHLHQGKPTMVDVTQKNMTHRSATAEAVVKLGAVVMEKLHDGEIRSAKGPVFQTAIIAGTMATKQTSSLIPFCHPLPLEHADITIEVIGEKLRICCHVATSYKTGVEMEAMTGASVAALTVYDMCKSLNKGIVIESVRLLRKTGGKSGDYIADNQEAEK